MNANYESILFNCWDLIALDNIITEEELNLIETYLAENEGLKRTDGDEYDGPEGGGIKDSRIRDSDLIFHNYDPLNERNIEVFQTLFSLTSTFNDNYFGFDIAGFNFFQYTEYNKQGQHYTWHCDKFDGRDIGNIPYSGHRKLSFSLVLSEPDEYEGGDFEIYNNGSFETPEQKKGTILAFPSWALHRVTPIKSGIRRSLVWWAIGPKFK